MSPESIERAASLLHAARRDHALLPCLPADCRPSSLEEGYAVQDRLFELLDSEVGGWFVGCTNPRIQEQLGLDCPYSGRLLAPVLHESPTLLRVPGALPVVLEVEFAFRLARDLVPRSAPYAAGEVEDAIASVHPAIEVVISHFEDWTHQDVFSLIADNGTDGALVFGAGVEAWREIDLPGVAATLVADGQVVREGRGEDVGEGPLSALVWLANHLAAKGVGLRAGDIHNTGSCTGMYFAEGDARVHADFGELGIVELELS